ncbi:Aste57867_20662 [Aphanomyces stellatus]|uniref:Aste57867_20662 protein n=1 Tax=Aphanomyces stellatus TaxID=120398 RepID=A0A485KHY3_9STRA|nr:hypothetical protein As57867_020594 [Aphanomyces stellatus]KAF0705857.1 hypothetical protein As57867_006879 [Aphanomyces stellatus]VFT83854.1 Aste57867_6901 [Aphanomyces stellatus]VFT97342.1 Aste57867_20662 [Aphanomyces stellatus]
MIETPTLLQSMRVRRQPVDLVNQEDQTLELDDVVAGLFLRKCRRITVVCRGKAAQITVQDCADVRLTFDSVLTSVEAIRSHGVVLAYSGRCGTITLDGCSQVELNVPVAKDAVPPLIVCTHVVDLRLRAVGDNCVVVVDEALPPIDAAQTTVTYDAAAATFRADRVLRTALFTA